MTVILGLETRGGVVVGGDSLSAAGYSSFPSSEAKVFRVQIPTRVVGEYDEVLMGCTSSWRFLQIMKRRLRPPVVGDADPDVYMATGFSDAVRRCLVKHGWAKKDQRYGGGYAVAGFRGRVYLVQSAFDVMRPACGYMAVGAGEDLATGALAALLAGRKHPPDVDRGKALVTQALEAACAHSPWCAPPLTVEVART